jgi:hypothetical protein
MMLNPRFYRLTPTLFAAVLSLPFLMPVPALAQNAPTPEKVPAPQNVDPKACNERLNPQTNAQRPGAGTTGQGATNQTLSEHLERTDGVICPPLGLDPEIVEAPPGGGRTPVIPPPGSPGGDPTVRPK